MATYKVPQDVEAEDKLIGPFSFRQFVYLIIATGAGAASFFLFMAVFPLPLLSIITLPIFVLFAVIALPLRKDQPMELYVLAMIRFFLKPKRRIWNPDGTTTGVVIEVPMTNEISRAKDLSQEEAANRLSYLANIVDTRGWAAKGVSVPQDTSVYANIADETYAADDILDVNSEQARSFDTLLNKQQQVSQEALRSQVQQSIANTPAPMPSMSIPPITNPYDAFLLSDKPATIAESPQVPILEPPTTSPAMPVADSNPLPEPTLHFNPYPSSMHQKTIDPYGRKPSNVPERKPETAVTPDVAPAIINLANNNDLSIEAIAHEAQRLADKNHGEEVTISLR